MSKQLHSQDIDSLLLLREYSLWREIQNVARSCYAFGPPL